MDGSRLGPGADTLGGLIEALGRRHAAVPALLALDRDPIDFGGLDRRVAAIRSALRKAGVEAGDRVGLVLPSGPDLALGVLGVASWCACAPFNAALGWGELAAGFRDLSLRAVILPDGAAVAARDAAREAGVAVLAWEETGAGSGAARTPAMDDAAARAIAARVPADDPSRVALVLRTSGTTSRPKVVPLTHANLLASARAIAATLALAPSDRCLNVMPLFHIHGLVGVLLSSLSAGASVVCTPGLGADDFLDWLARFAPTWYSAVPTMHQAVLRAGAARAHEARAARLRFVRSSSASLPPRVMSELETLFGTPVIEAYGMTEASHQMASNPLPPGTRKPGSVGLPAGTEVRVVTPDGTGVPAGARGEIVIRGPGVTAGYDGDPAINRAAFVDGWLRTGDEGRFDADGYLYVTGRLKELINRGGEKVSPKEIDEALLDHPQVLEAAAFGVAHPSLGEDVAAAVVVRDRAGVDEPALRAFLIARLAPFKVPSRIRIVDAIPKGATGKVERGTLSSRLLSAEDEPFVAPRGRTEGEVARAFEAVLEVERVGRTGNFWALGGDSLRAARVLARLQAACAVELPILALFEHPTVAEVARAIDAAIASGAARAASGPVRRRTAR